MEGKEILPGTLEMLILKTLSRGANHGYGIAQHIQSISGDALKIGEGSLYPGPAAPARQRLGTCGVGSLRKQPQGTNLQTHAGRPQASRRRTPHL